MNTNTSNQVNEQQAAAEAKPKGGFAGKEIPMVATGSCCGTGAAGSCCGTEGSAVGQAGDCCGNVSQASGAKAAGGCSGDEAAAPSCGCGSSDCCTT
ncbi:MAG: hypothetical protein JRN16_06380 [Nitrososphaerota archaeon]|nr:hypothetical protein [Nitrososphaerota archaeon]